jgi:hypothetical protein
MVATAYNLQSFGGISNIPYQVFGRSFNLTVSGQGSYDVYQEVRNDVFNLIPPGLFIWLYEARWWVRLRLDSTNLNRYKQFPGFFTRRNIGYIQYGALSGVTDDEPWVYTVTQTKIKRFMFNHANIRQDITIPAVNPAGGFPVDRTLSTATNYGGVINSVGVATEKDFATNIFLSANFNAQFTFTVYYDAFVRALATAPGTFVQTL